MSDRSDPDGQAFSVSLSRLLTTKSFGRSLHFFPSIDSTNTYAARLAREGAVAGSVVIADEQTGGKGRLGRSWVSPPGVIFICPLSFARQCRLRLYRRLGCWLQLR